MGESYLGAVLRFAFRRSILRSDQVSIVIALVTPMVKRLAGDAVPFDIQEPALFIAGMAIASGIVLRFLCAPYFIWKEQNEKLTALQKEVDSPRLIERQKFAELMALDRKAMAEEVTRIRMYVCFEDWDQDSVKRVMHGSEKYTDKFWHDEEFRNLWSEFTQVVSRYVASTLLVRANPGNPHFSNPNRKLKLELDEIAARVLARIIPAI